jgi:hypothetical protein
MIGRSLTRTTRNSLFNHKSLNPSLFASGYYQLQQNRQLYFALPLLIIPAMGTFVGITFWQVYKKRQAEELALKMKESSSEIIDIKTKTDENNEK